MILTTTPKLRKRRTTDWWDSPLGRSCSPDWSFCAPTVANYFALPNNTRTIWFITHDRPGVYRYEVQWVFCRNGLTIGDDQEFVLARVNNAIHHLKLPSTFYVECQYVES